MVLSVIGESTIGLSPGVAWIRLIGGERHVGTSAPIGEISGRNILACRARLLAPQGVFQPADGALHFALEPVGFAFAFELAVADCLSNNLLHFALGLRSRASDAIFVHHNGFTLLKIAGL